MAWGLTLGMNIIVRDDAGKEHPDWDDCRMAGDREWAASTDRLPQVRYLGGGWLEDAIRPADFSAWRDALPADRVNPERIPHLLDLLEADARWWVYFSY